jgi:hypothetical protein
MGDFYDITIPDSITRDECDRIAVEHCGVVRSIGYGYACSGTLPERVHDYVPRWVDKRGMGNHGSLVLTAGSPRSRELLRQGWVRRLMTQHRLDRSSAVRLEEASRLRRGRETGVLSCVIVQILAGPAALRAWESYPGRGGGVYHWANRWQIDTGGLSAPRLDAVAAVLRRGGWVRSAFA